MAETKDQTIKYTYSNVNSTMDSMRKMFDIVRLVDAQECREVSVTENGELLFGKDCYAVWDSDHRCANCTSYQACHTHRKKNRTEFFNGKIFQIQSIPVSLMLPDETTYACNMELISFSDNNQGAESVNKEKNSWETSGYLSTHDTLTGVLNWGGFCKNARRLISDNKDKKYFLITLDVANFRLVNTLFGNSTGDEVLIGISDILKEMCKSQEGTFGRTGGVNFAVCIETKIDVEEWTSTIASRIAGLIESQAFSLTTHFGIYKVEDINLPITILYDRAFLALESIMSNEKKIYAYYQNKMLEKALHEQRIISDFKKNLRSKQFIIYLQPQVNSEGDTEGAECLVRWILPDGSVITPADFVDILEQSSLIGTLDEYVWELAVKQLAEWKGTWFDNFYLSVNVSPKDFYYLDVASVFPALCKKYDVNPSKLHIEITETAVADEMRNNMETFEKLQQAGFCVEIDDFGKGSSSLGLLKDLKADVLKIDMRFIQNSICNARSNVILKSVIDMAKNLEMEVISEGIETKNQLINLKTLGCDVFQGFYFSKPIPVDDFERFVMDKALA
ncbi:GGDEF domain-containing phosphodiesterase [Butyrivibrio sp. AE3004]|uniref:GGDEF domain-containing phosphodiesterase n=1 Tax=Butyrivibrio sp. AE3004 TaxID=1506994 RepID=UPI000494D216|nr:GGDEF domain-containing phosphodiesterase [Butyrivibrio sp. AE3004]